MSHRCGDGAERQSPCPMGVPPAACPAQAPTATQDTGCRAAGGAQYDTREGRVYGGLNDAELLPSSSGRRNSKMRHAGLKSKRGWGCFPSRGFRGDLLALGAVFVPRHGAPSPTSGPSGAASVGVCLSLALALTSALVTPSPPLIRLSPLPPSDEAPVITWRLLH